MSHNLKQDDMTKIRDKKVPITTLIYKNVIMFYGFFFHFFFTMVFETFAKIEY